jgi:hypothetical protein
MFASDFESKGEVPHYVGYLTVYRVIEINPGGGMRSPMRSYNWNPGMNRAFCNIYGRVAAEACSCGFYAYFSPLHARQYLQWSDQGAIAVAHAYGRMTVGDNGLRAEKMEIVGIIPRITHDDFEELKGNKRKKKQIPAKPAMPQMPNSFFWQRMVATGFLVALLFLDIFVDSTWSKQLYWAAWAAVMASHGVALLRARSYLKKLRKWENAHKKWVLATVPTSTNPFDYIQPEAYVRDRELSKFKQLYPEIEVFDTLKEAVDKHPPSSASDL